MKALLRTVLLLVPVAASPAQADRMELGLRLTTLERELATATAPRRLAACRELERAVQAFFRLDTREVARAIEDAAQALREEAWSREQRYARALGLSLHARLVPEGGTVRATVDLVFDPFRIDEEEAADEDAVERAGDTAAPADLLVELSVPGGDVAPVRRALGELPLEIELPLRGVAAGDRTVRFAVLRGDTVLAAREQMLSIATDLDARLARLDSVEPARDDLEGRTFTGLVRTLQAMTRRRAEETTLPGERLLREAEALAALAPDARWYGPARPGQHWLRVPVGTGTEVVRIAVPENLDPARRVPLVLALHGAGGSENLFCDGYGAGAIVPLCAERGWILAAPRARALGGAPDLAGLADALAERWPIDRDRVFVVGHSMGAMGATAAAMRTPDRFAGIAALGGGGSVRRSPALRALPFFVGAGSRDFGRGGALALRDRLRQAGAEVEWREYEGIEHLTVVQFALPDVFAFFDRLAAAQPGRAR